MAIGMVITITMAMGGITTAIVAIMVTTATIDVSQPAWPAPQEAGGLGR